MSSKIDELYECLEKNKSLFQLPIIVEDGCGSSPNLCVNSLGQKKLSEYVLL